MIRDIEEKDKNLLIKLYREIFDTNISFNEKFNYKKVYVINDKIVGFIDYSIIYDRVEINYIYVLDEFRRQGIASILLNNIPNCTNITLEVNENNTKAINFYKNSGFNIVSKRLNYYKDGSDAYLMLKVIK